MKHGRTSAPNQFNSTVLFPLVHSGTKEQLAAAAAALTRAFQLDSCIAGSLVRVPSVEWALPFHIKYSLVCENWMSSEFNSIDSGIACVQKITRSVMHQRQQQQLGGTRYWTDSYQVRISTSWGRKSGSEFVAYCGVINGISLICIHSMHLHLRTIWGGFRILYGQCKSCTRG